MPLRQVASQTKLTVTAPALGRGGAASCCWVPRPLSYGEVFETEVTRSWTGISSCCPVGPTQRPGSSGRAHSAVRTIRMRRTHRVMCLSSCLCLCHRMAVREYLKYVTHRDAHFTQDGRHVLGEAPPRAEMKIARCSSSSDSAPSKVCSAVVGQRGGVGLARHRRLVAAGEQRAVLAADERRRAALGERAAAPADHVEPRVAKADSC